MANPEKRNRNMDDPDGEYADQLELRLAEALDDPEFDDSLPEWDDASDLAEADAMSSSTQTAQALGAIDRHDDRPPFRQIASLIRTAIEAGLYRDGDQIPPEGELIAHFSVARMTVRGAIKQLRIEGILRSEHGRGVFVCNPAVRLPAGPLNLDDLVDLAEVIGQVTGHGLSPNQSSKLKNSYRLAQADAGGATLSAIAAAARQMP